MHLTYEHFIIDPNPLQQMRQNPLEACAETANAVCQGAQPVGCGELVEEVGLRVLSPDRFDARGGALSPPRCRLCALSPPLYIVKDQTIRLIKLPFIETGIL